MATTQEAHEHAGKPNIPEARQGPFVAERRMSDASFSTSLHETPDDSYGAMMIDPLPADNEKSWEPMLHKRIVATANLLISVLCASYWLDEDMFWAAWGFVSLYHVADIVFLLTMNRERNKLLPGILKTRMLLTHLLGGVTCCVAWQDNLQIWFCAYWMSQIIFTLRDILSFYSKEHKGLKKISRVAFFVRIVYIVGVVGFFASDEVITKKADSLTVVFLIATLVLGLTQLLALAGTIRRFIKQVKHSPDPGLYFRDVLIYAIFVENLVMLSILLIYIPETIDDVFKVGTIFACYFLVTAWAAYYQGAWSDRIGVTNQIFWIAVLKTLGCLGLYAVRDLEWTYTLIVLSATAICGSMYTPYKVLASRRGDNEREWDLVLMFLAMFIGSTIGLLATSLILDQVNHEFFFFVICAAMFSTAWLIGLLYRLKAVKKLNHGHHSGRHHHVSRRTIIAPIRLPLIIQFFNAMTLFLLFSQFVIYLEEVFDYTLVTAAFYFALVTFIRGLGAAFLAFGTGTDESRSKGSANTLAILNVFFWGFGIAKQDSKGMFIFVSSIGAFLLQYSQADFLFVVEDRTPQENLGKALGIHDAVDMLGSATGSLLGGVLADSNEKGVLFGCFVLTIFLLMFVLYDSCYSDTFDFGSQQANQGGRDSGDFDKRHPNSNFIDGKPGGPSHDQSL